MTMPSAQAMRTALATRDKTYDGRFFYGVITTGIFCRPSCTARRAKAENLRFFSDTGGALRAGFRPCKRCLPMTTHPEFTRLVAIARYIESHAEDRLTLTELAQQAALSASRLQRVFKSAFGVSPKVFQDAIRMKRFKAALKTDGSIIDAIFATGLGSGGRIHEEAKRRIAMTPNAYRQGGDKELITYVCRRTVLGNILMAATERGICSVEFGQDTPSLVSQLHKEFPGAKISPITSGHNPELDAWIDALNTHLSQGTPRPELPLDLRGTALQIGVWRFLLKMSEGETISYRELATRVEKPRAIRAVANACAANRIGVLIPCHRVLRSDATLGGYRWGFARKRALLEMERRRLKGKEEAEHLAEIQTTR